MHGAVRRGMPGALPSKSPAPQHADLHQPAAMIGDDAHEVARQHHLHQQQGMQPGAGSQDQTDLHIPIEQGTHHLLAISALAVLLCSFVLRMYVSSHLQA